MVLLGDVVFMLVAKDPDTLWDPIGGVAAAGSPRATARGWPPWLFVHWVDRRARCSAARSRSAGAAAAWIASDRGQRGSRAASWPCSPRSAATVAIAWRTGTLDERHRRDRRARPPARARGARRRARRGAGDERTAPLGRVVVLFVASIALLSRVGGGDAGRLSLPARAAARHDRPRLLPRASGSSAPRIRGGARRS